MKAVILVGGLGTRLKPLTINTPKAMMPVLNTPFLEYVIRRLSRHHITEIVLAISHLAQPIEGYFGNGSRLGVSLSYTIEETALGTIRLAQSLNLDFYAFYWAAPYPGSPLYTEACNQGWLKGKKWADFNQFGFVMDLPTISKRRLLKLRRKAYSSVYLRPRSLKTAFSLFTVNSFISGTVSAIKYLTRIRKTT